MMTFRDALSELSGSQKSKAGVSLYSRFVNRPSGRVFAAMAYRARMSPNQVTAASAIVTAAGLLIVVTVDPSPVTGVLVALLLAVGFALDSADGQVARLTGRGSLAGEWLDHVVDSAKTVAVHGAVLVAAFRFFDMDRIWLITPLAFQVVAVVIFFGGELQRLLLLTRADVASPRAAQPSLVRSVALLPADYGVLALSFVLLGWPAAFIAVYTALLAANTVIMALLLAKWFRALSAA